MDKSINISKLLSNCQDDKKFYVCDGTTYLNLYELMDGLKTMKNETFNHHANRKKNDFMNWVKDVFKDNRLAKEIAKIKTPTTMAKKVEARIQTLQKI